MSSKKPNQKNYVPVILEPMADATPVKMNGAMSIKNPPNKKTEGVTAGTGSNLSIVAPMTMAAGANLYVDCDGSTYMVKIPEGGVQEGDTFIASGHRKAPITGDWKDSLFDCFSDDGGSFILAACFVPIIAWGCLMEPLRMDCCFGRNNTSTFPKRFVFGFMCLLCLVYTSAYVCVQVANITAQQANTEQILAAYNAQANGNSYNSNNSYGGNVSTYSSPSSSLTGVQAIVSLATWYILALFIAVRIFARMKYKIPGNCCTDCLSVYFCSCCSALQIFRHMKASGDEPVWTRTTRHTEAILLDQEGGGAVLQAHASVIDGDYEPPLGKQEEESMMIV